MITQRVTGKRSIVHKNDTIRSAYSAMTKKFSARRSQQSSSAGFEPQTQIIFVILYPNSIKTGIAKSISPTELTRISIPTSSTLTAGITKPLQVPTKTFRSNSDIHNDPTFSEKITSQDRCFGVTSHQCEFQNTATLPFSQFERTQRNLPNYNPFTAFINPIQRTQTVTKQQKKSTDQTLYNHYDCFNSVNTSLGSTELS